MSSVSSTVSCTSCTLMTVGCSGVEKLLARLGVRVARRSTELRSDFSSICGKFVKFYQFNIH